VYAFAALDGCGRIACQTVVQVLQWQPGTRLRMVPEGGVISVSAVPDGAYRVDGQGHLRVPAMLRAWCGLAGGSRVLLAAEPQRGRLLVCPTAVLDALFDSLAGLGLGGAASEGGTT
jgi:hypothetical protein